MRRAFKYRFNPTDAQTLELSRTFGCVRKVYNPALQARAEAWAQRQERVSYDATSTMLTAWKRTEELAFLNVVSSVPLQQALRHLQTAFANFFAKRARHPRFKSRKKSRASAEYTRSAFRWRDGVLTLATMPEPLDIRWSRPLPEGSRPSTVTVSQDSAGRWFVSLLCEDTSVQPLPGINSAVGIDVGLDHLLVLPTGEKIINPRHEARDRLVLAKAQRALSRKQKGSNNRAKARVGVGRVIEDLAVSNLTANHSLARSISDAGRRQFRQMLEYKASWYGRDVIAVDRWFPSCKLCSIRGALAATMPLHLRTWTCGCGATRDRDVNAARNILAAGLAVTVCGAGVRPQRSAPGGQSAAKQKSPQREPRESLVHVGNVNQAPP